MDKKFYDVNLEQEYQGTVLRDNNWKAHHVVCTLEYNDVQEEFDFYMGMGLTPNVDLYDLLDALFMDANTFENSEDALDILEEGIAETGKQAREIYNGCKETFHKLNNLFGEDYDAIRNEVVEYMETA